MKNHLILAIVLLISSCASKYPMKLDPNDYKKGLLITNSIVPTRKLFDSACVTFDSKVPVTLQLRHKIDNDIMFFYENKSLLKIYSFIAKCLPEDTITVTDFKSTQFWNFLLGQNLYVVKVLLKAQHHCQNKPSQFSSVQQSRLLKHGKFVKLGQNTVEEEKAVTTAALVLAFDAAITDIYQQIKQQCQ